LVDFVSLDFVALAFLRVMGLLLGWGLRG